MQKCGTFVAETVVSAALRARRHRARSACEPGPAPSVFATFPVEFERCARMCILPFRQPGWLPFLRTSGLQREMRHADVRARKSRGEWPCRSRGPLPVASMSKAVEPGVERPGATPGAPSSAGRKLAAQPGPSGRPGLPVLRQSLRKPSQVQSVHRDPLESSRSRAAAMQNNPAAMTMAIALDGSWRHGALKDVLLPGCLSIGEAYAMTIPFDPERDQGERIRSEQFAM